MKRLSDTGFRCGGLAANQLQGSSAYVELQEHFISSSSGRSDHVPDGGALDDDDDDDDGRALSRLGNKEESRAVQDDAAAQSYGLLETYSLFPHTVKLIVGNELCERFSFYGLRSILTLYMVNELKFTEAAAISMFAYSSSFAYLMPIVGGIVSDSYLGKFQTILYFSIVYVVGSVTLALTAIDAQGWGLYIAIVLISLGTGGIKPCVSSFGADQFDMTNPLHKAIIGSYFRWFYSAINFGSVISIIVTPIIRTSLSYAAAFFLPAILLSLSIAIFLWGYNDFLILPPTNKSIIIDVATIVYRAGCGRTSRNSGCCYSSNKSHQIEQGEEEMQREFHGPNDNSEEKAVSSGPDDDCLPGKRRCSQQDHAAATIATSSNPFLFNENPLSSAPPDDDVSSPRQSRLFHQDPDRSNTNIPSFPPFRDSTVSTSESEADEDGSSSYLDFNGVVGNEYSRKEVDAVKKVIDLLPVFCCFPIFWALFDQQGSTWVLQCEQMDLRLGSMTLQPEQLQAFNPVLILILLPVMDRVVYPSLFKNNLGLSLLGKVCMGMLFAAAAFCVSGFIELSIAASVNPTAPLKPQPGQPYVPISSVSVLWQIPQYILISLAEILVSVTGLEFAYVMAPKTMKSTVAAIFLLTTSVGDLLTGVIFSVFPDVTRSTMAFICALLMVANLCAMIYVKTCVYKDADGQGAPTSRLNDDKEGGYCF